MNHSKFWDHKSTFDQLLQGKDVVYLDLTHKPHASDDGYGGVCMYIPHDGNNNGYTQVSIFEDGVCYEGDSYPEENNPYNLGEYIVKTTPKIGCELLEQWGKTIKEVYKMSSLLVSHWKSIEHDGYYNQLDCVICKISDSYRHEN